MVAALCLGLFFLTACSLGSAQAAAIATFLLAVSSSLYTTVGLGLWQHGGVVFWSLLALFIEFSSGGMPSKKGSVIQGMACAAMLTCRPTAALGVVGLGTWIFLRAPKRAFFTMAVAAVSYLPCIGLYEVTLWQHARPLHHSARHDRGALAYRPVRPPSRRVRVPGPGTLRLPAVGDPCPPCSGSRGSPPDEGSGRRRQPAGWMAYCLVIPLIHCAVVSAWHDWSGGYCWGSRLVDGHHPASGALERPGDRMALANASHQVGCFRACHPGNVHSSAVCLHGRGRLELRQRSRSRSLVLVQCAVLLPPCSLSRSVVVAKHEDCVWNPL